MGRRAELMYVTMSLNLEIRQQRSCIQFTLHTVTLNSAFSPDQSVDICSETSAQLLHGCSATVLVPSSRHLHLVCYTNRHSFWTVGRSGRVVSTSHCGLRGPRFRISPLAVVFIMTVSAIYSLGHGLQPLLQGLGRLRLPPSVRR